jgi:glutamate/tyrosine decarboxylase-like PLP-dependent enzyme
VGRPPFPARRKKQILKLAPVFPKRQEPAMPDAPKPVQDLSWNAERAGAHGDFAVSIWKELLGTIAKLPVARRWKDIGVKEALSLAIPDEPLSDAELFAKVRDLFFKYSMYPGHPRFMAFITGPGTVPGAVADFLAAQINQNVGGWRLSPGASEIEAHVTRWFAQRFGLPETAGGLMVSGGAMANFVGLKAARDAKCGWNVREAGVTAGAPLAIYASEQVHDVSFRAADMLGLGTRAVRRIPVDREYRMRVDALAKAMADDVAAGVRPLAVVGTAGTVSTGAIDPLGAIADVCQRHGVWFHVDGAYGALAILADDLRPQLAGIERADSIAFDPHKWLYVPQSAGCVVVRDLQHLADAFAVHPAYVREDKERTGHGLDMHMIGPQFSRGFQAFKVWLSLLAHGAKPYGRRISHDAALARYMAAEVEKRDELEVMASVPLSICCFRFVPRDLGASADRDAYLDRLNERIMTEIQLDGRVFISNAVLGGRFVLRACIVNFRTEAPDVTAVLDVACEIGRRVDRELRDFTARDLTRGGA